MTQKNKTTFANSLLGNGFRDTDLIGHGQIAQTMRNEFFNLFRIWEHRMLGTAENRYFGSETKKTSSCPLFHQEEGLIRNCQMKYIISGPEHRARNPISRELAHLMRKAKKEIRIANLLFNPDATIRTACSFAKKKGIKITGYLNGTKSLSHYLYALPNRLNYDLLTEAYEYHAPEQLYHKKVTTIDGRYTMVGSFNLGVKSARCDYESVAIIDDPRIAAAMNRALDVDALPVHSSHLNEARLKKTKSTVISRFAVFSFSTLFG